MEYGNVDDVFDGELILDMNPAANGAYAHLPALESIPEFINPDVASPKGKRSL